MKRWVIWILILNSVRNSWSSSDGSSLSVIRWSHHWSLNRDVHVITNLKPALCQSLIIICPLDAGCGLSYVAHTEADRSWTHVWSNEAEVKHSSLPASIWIYFLHQTSYFPKWCIHPGINLWLISRYVASAVIFWGVVTSSSAENPQQKWACLFSVNWLFGGVRFLDNVNVRLYSKSGHCSRVRTDIGIIKIQ